MGDMTQKIKYPSNDSRCAVPTSFFFVAVAATIARLLLVLLSILRSIPCTRFNSQCHIYKGNNEPQPNILCAKMEHCHFFGSNGNASAAVSLNEFLKCFDLILYFISSGNFSFASDGNY